KPFVLAMRQEFSRTFGEIKKDYAGLAEFLSSVNENRNFAHFVNIAAIFRRALHARLEEIDEDGLPIRTNEIEHQGRAVSVTRLGEAIELIFSHRKKILLAERSSIN